MSDYVAYRFHPLTQQEFRLLAKYWRPLWYRLDPFGVGAVDEVEFWFRNGLCLLVTYTPDGQFEASLGAPEDDA